MKTKTVVVSLGVVLLLAGVAWMMHRTSMKPEAVPEAPPVASAVQAAQVEELARIAKIPEPKLGASAVQTSGATAALAKGLDSGAQAFKALSQDQTNVKVGKLTELQLDDRGRTVHAPRFRRVMQDLAGAKFPPGDPRAAFAQDYTRLVALVLEGLTMESSVVNGKPVPVNPARVAVIEAEIQKLNSRIPKEMEELKTLQGAEQK